MRVHEGGGLRGGGAGGANENIPLTVKDGFGYRSNDENISCATILSPPLPTHRYIPHASSHFASPNKTHTHTHIHKDIQRDREREIDICMYIGKPLQQPVIQSNTCYLFSFLLFFRGGGEAGYDVYFSPSQVWLCRGKADPEHDTRNRKQR